MACAMYYCTKSLYCSHRPLEHSTLILSGWLHNGKISSIDFGQITCNLAYTQRLDSVIAIGCMHLMKKEKEKKNTRPSFVCFWGVLAMLPVQHECRLHASRSNEYICLLCMNLMFRARRPRQHYQLCNSCKRGRGARVEISQETWCAYNTSFMAIPCIWRHIYIYGRIVIIPFFFSLILNLNYIVRHQTCEARNLHCCYSQAHLLSSNSLCQSA